MGTPKLPHGTVANPRARWGLLGQAVTWLLNEPVLCWVGALCALVTLFYLEEDWRGRRAWLQCKRALEAKGAALNWAAHIPPPVPEDKNFFHAPNMTQWFVGKGANPLTQRLNLASFYQVNRQTSSALANVTVVPLDAVLPAGAADLEMQFAPPVLIEPPGSGDSSKRPARVDPVLPLIVLDNVPLTDAIRHLARQAGLNYVLDPTIRFAVDDLRGPAPQPTVSVRWEHVTGLQALVALLNKYALQISDDPKSGNARITQNRTGGDLVYAEPSLRERLERLGQTGRPVGPNETEPRGLKGSQGIRFMAGRRDGTGPARITVRASTIPTSAQVAAFFPPDPTFQYRPSRPQVVPAGTNAFRVYFSPPQFISAADYLEWSDRFTDDFDQIREAIKRPYAQMPGDYRDPISMPIPNFVAVRMLVQTLGQRAQCYLLLDQPESALRELSLIHGLCGVLEAKPTGKPMTLVAAMIHVAVSGLYVDVVRDGLRLKVWREKELAAIQGQLQQVDLPPLVAESCAEERAASCRIFESATGSQFASLFSSGPAPASLWTKLKDPTFLFFNFAPRGWVYQNMCSVASLEDKAAASLDRSRDLVVPHQFDLAAADADAALRHFSPTTFLVSMALPNYRRAWQTAALNQTRANQALIACGLERYRLASGRHPETIEELRPKFVDSLPRDIINGQPLHYRLKADGSYLLYSVGWNERDEGGVPGERDQGDWVWDPSAE
jgi:hypothetical protein